MRLEGVMGLEFGCRSRGYRWGLVGWLVLPRYPSARPGAPRRRAMGGRGGVTRCMDALSLLRPVLLQPGGARPLGRAGGGGGRWTLRRWGRHVLGGGGGGTVSAGLAAGCSRLRWGLGAPSAVGTGCSQWRWGGASVVAVGSGAVLAAVGEGGFTIAPCSVSVGDPPLRVLGVLRLYGGARPPMSCAAGRGRGITAAVGAGRPRRQWGGGGFSAALGTRRSRQRWRRVDLGSVGGWAPLGAVGTGCPPWRCERGGPGCSGGGVSAAAMRAKRSWRWWGLGGIGGAGDGADSAAVGVGHSQRRWGRGVCGGGGGRVFWAGEGEAYSRYVMNHVH